MDLYTNTSIKLAELLTRKYSTSFNSSSRLLGKTVRPYIYTIYAFVRIADEIVDTYSGVDALKRINELEWSTKRALQTGYDANPIVHAFSYTARKYHIDPVLLDAFFKSMRMDLTPRVYTKETYDIYIQGSAEAVGLMCLHVFCPDTTRYHELKVGAAHLGAAYQKVNFLRDIADDHKLLGRFYFPNVSYAAFGETAKQVVIDDITSNLLTAKPYIKKLPPAAKRGVKLSYAYYETLVKKLERTSVDTLKKQRVRIPNGYKLLLFLRTLFPGEMRV